MTRTVDSPLATREVVTVSGVEKRYGSVVALNGVDLAVREGTIYGLVGPNGCGKTTLLNVLSGFIRPDKGQVDVLGKKVAGGKATAVARAGVGRTFQTPRVFGDLDLWENLQVGIDGALLTESEFWLHRRLRERVDQWRGMDASVLPHGAQRLLEIVRVVARAPRVLLMDEPAAGLSSEERQGVVELLRRLRDELGMTVVIVEHDLRLVWSVADEIGVMNQGRIVETGTPDELKGRPTVEALFVGGSDA